MPEEARLGSAPVSDRGGDVPSPGSHLFRVYCRDLETWLCKERSCERRGWLTRDLCVTL